MAGSVVKRVEKVVRITDAGETVELDATEGNKFGWSVRLINGAYTGATLTIKRSIGSGGLPQAFATPISVTADADDDDADTEGCSRVVFTVEVAGSTSDSYVVVSMVSKGDRISTALELPPDPTRPDSILTEVPPGPGM